MDGYISGWRRAIVPRQVDGRTRHVGYSKDRGGEANSRVAPWDSRDGFIRQWSETSGAMAPAVVLVRGKASTALLLPPVLGRWRKVLHRDYESERLSVLPTF